MIGEDSILTAAHCCDPNGDSPAPPEIWGRFRNEAFESRYETDKYEYTLKIITRIMHPDYTGIQNGNDLCILKTAGNVLDQAVHVRAKAKIACLAGSALYIFRWLIT